MPVALAGVEDIDAGEQIFWTFFRDLEYHLTGLRAANNTVYGRRLSLQ